MPSFLLEIIILLSSLALLCWQYVKYCYKFWERKNVPYLKPKFPLGNGTRILPRGIAVGIISKEFYDKFRKLGHKIGEVYFGIQPKMIVMDPDYIRDILTKDFQYFVDRGIYQTESDPISVNIFSQPGDEWRQARTKFTSIFSSAKLKAMFQILVDSSKGMEEALEKMCEQKLDVDIHEVVGCFTTDVIGQCAFGITCNSFKYPDAEFRKMGKKVFEEFNIWHQLNLCLTIYTPKLADRLGIGNIQPDVSAFFFKTVKDAVEYREKNGVVRNDFMQLLIDLKNSNTKLSMNELTAQAFLFFLAGFETSSTTGKMALYELARNQEVQDKVREEILSVLKKTDGQVTYECLSEMKYLGQAIDETLRLWPPVPTVPRVCTKDYKFENSDIVVDRGTSILIPVLGLQRDPEYWPDPLEWKPERFSDENRDQRKAFTYLPFGDGPRNCLGLRFGLMQTKMAVLTILKNYRVVVSPKTVTPLGMDPDTFVFHTINKVYLNLEKI